MNIKITLLSFILLLSSPFFAQDALKVKYGKQEKWELNEESAKDPRLAEAELRAMEEIRDFELILFNNQAEYSFVQKIDNQQHDNDDSPRIIVSFGSDDEIQYSDYDTGVHYTSSTILSKHRIVKKNLPTYDWQLTRDTKKILGLEVRKATVNLDNDSIIAWYAPKISYKAGPEDVWGLPGLILEYKLISNNDYEIHVFAKELDYLKDGNIKINFPDDSAAISQEEYRNQIMEEAKRIEEMYSQGVDTSD